MSYSNGLQDILTASKAGINSLKAVQKRGEEELTGVVKTLTANFSEQGQTLVESIFGSIKAAGDNVLKLIGAAETRATGNVWNSQQKAVDLINQGLAAIEEKHNASIAMLQKAADFEISNIQGAAAIALAALEGDRPAEVSQDQQAAKD